MSSAAAATSDNERYAVLNNGGLSYFTPSAAGLGDSIVHLMKYLRSLPDWKKGHRVTATAEGNMLGSKIKEKDTHPLHIFLEAHMKLVTSDQALASVGKVLYAYELTDGIWRHAWNDNDNWGTTKAQFGWCKRTYFFCTSAGNWYRMPDGNLFSKLVYDAAAANTGDQMDCEDTARHKCHRVLDVKAYQQEITIE